MSVVTNSSSSNVIISPAGPMFMKLEKVENMGERDTLETPQLNSVVNPNSATITGDFPSTAELMQKVFSVNPFDMKFREANRRLSQGCQNIYDQGALNDSISVPTTGGVTLLKLPSTLSHSPGIFSNINVLSAGVDGETLQSAEFSRIVQQIKDSGGFSAQNSRTGDDTDQGPRTADVLNAVLDMDKLNTINYLASGGVSAITPTLPSASTIAASLASSTIGVAPSTSAPSDMKESTAVLQCSPSSSASVSMSQSGSIVHTDSVADSSVILNTVISTVPTTVSSLDRQPVKKRIAIRSTAQGVTSAAVQQNSLVAPSVEASRESTTLRLPNQVHGANDQWDPRDIKPLVIREKSTSVLQANQQYLQTHDESSFNQENLRQVDESHGPKSNESSSSTPSRSGRGRGRTSITADLPPDERRVTILERNKAAAVRYRKRKKEEHDEMISRVQTLEQEKVTLSTQNDVLRRELKRVNEELKIYRTQCVCRCGRGGDNIRGDSPVEVDTISLSQQTDLNTYTPQQMISAIHPNKKLAK